MADEPCPREKGRFDGGSFFGGIILMAVVAVFGIVIPFTATQDRRDHVVWVTDKGLVCKHNVYYPQASCDAVFRAFGPRASVLKVKP